MFAMPAMFGIKFVFLAFGLADFFTGIFGIFYYIHLYKKQKSVVKENEANVDL